MADLVEALHSLARQRGRGDSPLVTLRSVPARPGLRISHLPISQSLAHAWVRLTGEPFHQHQSLALAALRRGEPLALVGGATARQTMHLLMFELLLAEAPASILLLAPDEAAAAEHQASLMRIAAALDAPLRVGLVGGAEARAAMNAQIVVTTPAALHQRLLRHHERAWVALWSRLRLIVVAEAHSYAGLAAAHLDALLLRASRLGSGSRPPQLAATLAPVTGAEEALALITGLAWRIIATDDAPAPGAALALWRAPGERFRECAALAHGLVRAGATVHICCEAFAAPLLRTLIGAEATKISVGPSPLVAQAQIFANLDGATTYVRQSLDSAALSVLVLGDDPAERTLARLATHDPAQLPLLDGPPPTWVVAAGNAYVVAQHLVCAASERPFGADELEVWQAATIIPRLEQRGRLLRLPGPEPAWQPLAGSDDPYLEVDLRAPGGTPATIRDEQGVPLGCIDGSGFDRWGFVGAALPPLRGGFRVVARDEPAFELVVRSSAEQRRTIPLRNCTVRVRDRREQRVLRGRELAWGRVVIDEQIYGYREVSLASAPTEQALRPVSTTSWSAPALWVDLPVAINASDQLIGWSLAVALALRSLVPASDLVPAYDAEVCRLYFIDAHPGGNGAAVWLYNCLEELLPLAYDLALDCRSDPLLEPLARADMDWLLMLLGGGSERTPREPGSSSGGKPVREPVAPVGAGTERPRKERQSERVEERASKERQAREARALAEREAQATREREQAEQAARERERAAQLAHEQERLAQATQAAREQERLERAAQAAREREQHMREAQERATQTRQSKSSRPPPPAPRAPTQNTSKARGRSGGSAAPGRTHSPAVPARSAPRQRSEPAPPAPSKAPTLPAQALPREAEPLPDAAAMVARLRTMRKQRERQESHAQPERTPAVAAHADEAPGEPRFHPGDQIICTPYGAGEVLESRLSDDHELLVVRFATHGILTLNASLSAARLADEEALSANDDLPL